MIANSAEYCWLVFSAVAVCYASLVLMDSLVCLLAGFVAYWIWFGFGFCLCCLDLFPVN